MSRKGQLISNSAKSLLIFLVLLTLSVSVTIAQETTAGMQGYVKDQTGAMVPKATVEVTSPALIGTKKMETDESGYFRFAKLPRATAR